jgi:hypothetical protein
VFKISLLNMHKNVIAAVALLALCRQPGVAQSMSLTDQLSTMESAVFHKEFAGNSALWRIEHLEKSFPAASQQKKKDLPSRMRDLAEHLQAQNVQPQPGAFGEGAPGSDGSDQIGSRGIHDKQTHSKSPIGQAVGVPKSLMSGTKHALNHLTDFDDDSAQMPHMATRSHKFSGAGEDWSQEASILDWYRPNNLRGFTPHYVDGSESNDTGAYGRNRMIPARRPFHQSQYPQNYPNSQYPQRPQNSYDDELDHEP